MQIRQRLLGAPIRTSKLRCVQIASVNWYCQTLKLLTSSNKLQKKLNFQNFLWVQKISKIKIYIFNLSNREFWISIFQPEALSQTRCKHGADFNRN